MSTHHLFIHGESRKGRETPEYQAWHSMIQRCTNPNHKKYPLYGGRGIQVCDSWRFSFEAFLACVGRRPGPEYSLDRKRSNGNYEPGNVKWSTVTEQNQNKRTNKNITINGKTQCLAAWCRETGIPKSTVINRLNRGLSEAEALNQ